eukprot:403359184
MAQKKQKYQTYDESDEEEDDYGRGGGNKAANKFSKGGNNQPQKQQTDQKPGNKAGNKFELNKKNVFDDDDEYDDEIAPYPLNKHNDSYEKISAKTEPKWDKKASQDTFQKVKGGKPVLSDNSSQKGFKKTQKRYDDKNDDEDESDDDANFLKPQVNNKQPKTPLSQNKQGGNNPQSQTHSRQPSNQKMIADDDSEDDNKHKAGQNKKVPRKFSDEEEYDDEDDEPPKPPAQKGQQQPQLKQQKKQPQKSSNKAGDSDDEDDEDDDDASSIKKSQVTKNSKGREMENQEDKRQAEVRKNKQKSYKKNHHEFDFTPDMQDKEDQHPLHISEYGVPINELEDINAYFSLSASTLKKETKKKRKLAKHLRNKNYFFTSKCYMLFHLLQTVMFWVVVIMFPLISVIGCNGGHSWTSHIAIIVYLGLNFIFDLVFASQYYEKESIKYELKYNQSLNNEAKLKAHKKRKSYRRVHMDSDEELQSMQTDNKSRGSHMFVVFLEIIYELIMTQIGLIRIYCDCAFISIVMKESLKQHMAASMVSIGILLIPKLYAFFTCIYVMFGGVKTENKLRKHAYRILIFNEFRIQALNVEYVQHQKYKIDLGWGFMKFLFQDLPQAAIQIWYLLQTDCGTKNSNPLIIFSIVLALINTYFGFLYRFVNVCYSVNRLNSIKKRVQVVINNLLLSTFGFSNLRGKIHVNKKIQSVVFSGESYEYFYLNDRSVAKFKALMEQFPEKDQVQFIDAKRVKFESIREAKAWFLALDANYHDMKYLTIQECSLCKNFILQLKTFLDGNTSLLRLALVQNQMKEGECYEAIETSIDHPNIEIIQLAETKIQAKTKKGKQQVDESDFGTVCRGIENKLSVNTSLKVLEIRYMVLNRGFIHAIFSGLQTNKALQILTITHNSLNQAIQEDYDTLGKSLKKNDTLLSFDFSYNEELDDNLNFHKSMTDMILESGDRTNVRRIHMTSKSLDIKSHYLDVIDQKSGLIVYMNEKILEDVDVQDNY